MKNEKAIKAVLVGIIIVLLGGICFLTVSGVFSCRGKLADADVNSVEVTTAYDELCKQLANGNTSISLAVKSEEAVHAAVELVYDRPELFWMGRDYQIVSVGGKYSVRFSEYYVNHDSMLAEVENVADNIIAEIPEGASEYEKVKLVHDMLCDRISYVDTDSENEHNIYGALVRGESVCEGYAKAFMYILNRLGIETKYFSGTSVKNGVAVAHAWNGAYIDGEFYYFDITWDDIESKYISYSQFALTSDDILRNHSFDEYHPMIETSATKYNYYLYNGYVLDEYSKEAVADIVKRQGNIIDIKCSSIVAYNKLISAIENPYQLNEILTMAKSENTGFNSFSYMIDETTYCVRLYFE